MDHQIQDNVDIKAARSEQSHPMRFKEAGPSDDLPQGSHGRVESLEVSYLQDAVIPCRRGNQPVGAFQRIADRLLHEHVDARVEKLRSNLSVKCCRGGNADGVNLAQKLAIIVERLRPKRCGNFLGPAGSGIRDSRQSDLGHGRVHPGMMLAERPNSHHAHSEFVHSRFTQFPTGWAEGPRPQCRFDLPGRRVRRDRA